MSTSIAALAGNSVNIETLQSGSKIAALHAKAEKADQSELRSTFDSFVGEVFFGQMMESMRKSVGKPAYMHGGRGEEVFQKQLDQMFSQEMSKASAAQFTGPMFDLFTLNRS